MTDLKSLIRTIPDHPKPGIQFRDITTLLLDPIGLRDAVDQISNRYVDTAVDLVVGIEARGFIFGTAISYRLRIGSISRVFRTTGKYSSDK